MFSTNIIQDQIAQTEDYLRIQIILKNSKKTRILEIPQSAIGFSTVEELNKFLKTKLTIKTIEY